MVNRDPGSESDPEPQEQELAFGVWQIQSDGQLRTEVRDIILFRKELGDDLIVALTQLFNAGNQIDAYLTLLKLNRNGQHERHRQTDTESFSKPDSISTQRNRLELTLSIVGTLHELANCTESLKAAQLTSILKLTKDKLALGAWKKIRKAGQHWTSKVPKKIRDELSAHLGHHSTITRGLQVWDPNTPLVLLQGDRPTRADTQAVFPFDLICAGLALSDGDFRAITDGIAEFHDISRLATIIFWGILHAKSAPIPSPTELQALTPALRVEKAEARIVTASDTTPRNHAIPSRSPKETSPATPASLKFIGWAVLQTFRNRRMLARPLKRLGDVLVWAAGSAISIPLASTRVRRRILRTASELTPGRLLNQFLDWIDRQPLNPESGAELQALLHTATTRSSVFTFAALMPMLGVKSALPEIEAELSIAFATQLRPSEIARFIELETTVYRLCEKIALPYLQCITALNHIARSGDLPKMPPSTVGSAVKNAVDMRVSRILVRPAIALVRNAIAHPSVRSDDGSNTIIFRDDHSTASFLPHELKDLLEFYIRMARDSMALAIRCNANFFLGTAEAPSALHNWINSLSWPHSILSAPGWLANSTKSGSQILRNFASSFTRKEILSSIRYVEKCRSFQDLMSTVKNVDD